MKVKGKSVPLQAWSGPEGSRKLRFPDYTTMAQDGGKVVSLTHRPPLPPRKYECDLEVKVKQYHYRPGQAHRGSRKLRLPDFMTTAQDGGKVVSLTHRPPLPDPARKPVMTYTTAVCTVKNC